MSVGVSPGMVFSSPLLFRARSSVAAGGEQRSWWTCGDLGNEFIGLWEDIGSWSRCILE